MNVTVGANRSTAAVPSVGEFRQKNYTGLHQELKSVDEEDISLAKKRNTDRSNNKGKSTVKSTVRKEKASKSEKSMDRTLEKIKREKSIERNTITDKNARDYKRGKSRERNTEKSVKSLKGTKSNPIEKSLRRSSIEMKRDKSMERNSEKRASRRSSLDRDLDKSMKRGQSRERVSSDKHAMMKREKSVEKTTLLKSPKKEKAKAPDSNHNHNYSTSLKALGKKAISKHQAAPQPDPESSKSQLSSYNIMRLAHQMQDDLTQEGLVIDRRWHLRIYKQCFLHRDGMKWLVDQVIKLEELYVAQCPKENALRTSFACMEDYLRNLEIKAACLGNLMIQAGFISHVCFDHQFSIAHKNRTLFFRFHTDCIQRQQSLMQPSPLPPSLHHQHNHHYKQHIHDPLYPTGILPPPKNYFDCDERSVMSLGSRPALIQVFTGDTGDAASVVSLITQATGVSCTETTTYDSTREVDIGLLSIARDLYSDLKFMRHIKDRVLHLKVYKKCFLRGNAMEWLVRQVRIHYNHLIIDHEDCHCDGTPLPQLLSDEHAEMAAARIGNLMIQDGYISHVCNKHTFRANVRDELFFKFHMKVLDGDARKVNLFYEKEDEIDALQDDIFWRETKVILTKTTASPDLEVDPEQVAQQEQIFTNVMP